MINYPFTKKINQIDNYFNKNIEDPYRWLENDKDEEVISWTKEQNKLTDNYLNEIEYKDKIKERYQELMNFPKLHSPMKVGEYLFYYKNNGLENQYIIYFKKGEFEEEKIFLNPNEYNKEGTISFKLLESNEDHTLMAYLISKDGSDWNEIKIRNILLNKDLNDLIQWVKFSSFSWYNDGFFYSRYPKPKEGLEFSEKNENHMVYYHKINTNQEEDILEYQNLENLNLYHSLNITKDKKFLILHIFSGTDNNDIYFKNINSNNKNYIPIFKGFKSKNILLDHINNQFYIYTNLNSNNFKLISINNDLSNLLNPIDIIPEKNYMLSSVSTCGGFLFSKYLIDVNSKIFKMNLEGKNQIEIELPGLGSCSDFDGEPNDKFLYYSYTSFIYPTTIFKYDILNNLSIEFFKPEIKFNPNDFEDKQVWYKSKDNTLIPMFLISKKNIIQNNNNPIYLYGYGGFSIGITPYFSILSILLMEKGFIYAIPNIRGGDEFGEKWHQEGMLLNKKNVFDDFIYAIKYLINNNYSNPSKIVISGSSNGGLLTGYCLTQYPELFGCVLIDVGVLDMLRYHKFTIGWGWIPEYGSSEENEEIFNYLYSYSPLHNIKNNINYPSTLIITGDHDDRVIPAHSFKFTATLQNNQKSNNPILLKVNINVGHGSSTPISKIIEEQTLKLTFIFKSLNLNFF